ncbi:MAG: hypothetical protein K0S33_2643 [Bacteroidetes bacterium]|jgi:hypothetical protein|nr:hypothetical protein [Bacteroidota bacterium]
MSRILFFVYTFLFSFALSGQEQFSIGLGAEYSENFSIRNYSGTIQVEVPLGDRFGMNYKLGIGGSTDRVFYLHSPVGAAFGTILLKSLGGNNSSAVNTIGVLLIAIPEGITFYPNPDADIRVGIYVAPLGCDYWYKNSNYEYFRFSGEVGGKVKFPLGKDDRIDLQLQGGLRYLYRNKVIEPFFIHAGAGLSFNF